MTRSLSNHAHRCAGRAILGALALFLCAASAAPQGTLPVPDAQAGQQAALARMVKQGIMRGASPAQLDPAGLNVRGDFAASVQQLFDLPVPARHVDYLDVPPRSEYDKPIQAVSRYLGREMLCFGCQLTERLGPGEPVSRLEAVVTVTNVLVAQKRMQLVRPQADDLELSEVLSADGLRGPIRLYVATALRNEILLPTPANSLAPDVPFTRADLAALLDRVQRKFDIPQRSYAR